ncbi:MAG: gamma-glutamyl-gamma-aminobutyrate hydrolase family protein [Candidatus Poribacteria bacterium]|nr:gamma-glutamyl-gamma-aminobutyrate hydrolase family protein [Candidatus Poribacteria bacterium]
MSPIIGITCKKTTDDMQNYIDAIEQYGGEPRLFVSREKSVADHRDAISEYLSEIDALLLPGGGDMNPALFFEKRHSEVKGVSRSRDALEIWLCQDVLKADLPMLGVCRGIQVMSVAMRGSLYQHIPCQFTDPLLHKKKKSRNDSQHDIQIETGSLLNQITGDRVAKVNSRHHQSVKVIGDGFIVTAQSEDGVIEAIENPSKRFVLGVQYHPERMLKKPDMEAHAAHLFTAFIKAASQS